MKISIKKIIEPPISIAVFMLTLVCSLWFVSYFFGLNYTHQDQVSVFANFLNSLNDKYSVVVLLISFVLTIVNTILIQQINNVYSIIRSRTFLPILIFNILIAISFRTHGLINVHIALTCCILAIFLFLGMFRKPNASELAFMGSLFVALGSLFVKPILLLILFFWIGFIQLKSFSLRTFLASIIGLLVPWIFYFLFIFYYKTNDAWLADLSSGFEINFALFQQPLNEIIYFSTMMLILIIALGGLYTNMQSDSIQTRSNIMFISFYSLGVFVLFFLFNQHYVVFTPFLALSFTFLLSHPFSLRKSNFVSIIFIFFLITNFAFVFSCLLTLPT